MNQMREKKLTEGNILKGFLLFAIPLFLGSLFQQLYSTVDLIFAGRFIGKNAAAAIGASGIIVTCMIGLFTGISVGAGVVIAQKYGAGEKDALEESIASAIKIALIGGGVVWFFGLLFAGQALVWLNTPETLLSDATDYLRIYIVCALPMIVYNMGASIKRAMGDSKTPFWILAAGGILNVFMDTLLIVVLNLGIKGAALATLCSQTFTAVLILIFIRRRSSSDIFKKWNAKIAKSMIRVGVPIGIQSMVITLSNIFVQYKINGLGETAVAAFSVYFKAENLIYLPIMAFGQAMITFVGQNKGANQYMRIKKAIIQCNVVTSAIIIGLSVVCVLFGKSIIGFFVKDTDVIAVGVRIIRITFPLYFIYGIMELTGATVRGLGKTSQSMMIVIGNLCVLRVILLEIFTYFSNQIEAVAVVYPITWLTTALSFVVYYIFIRNSTSDLGAPRLDEV